MNEQNKRKIINVIVIIVLSILDVLTLLASIIIPFTGVLTLIVRFIGNIILAIIGASTGLYPITAWSVGQIIISLLFIPALLSRGLLVLLPLGPLISWNFWIVIMGMVSRIPDIASLIMSLAG